MIPSVRGKQEENDHELFPTKMTDCYDFYYYNDYEYYEKKKKRADTRNGERRGRMVQK